MRLKQFSIILITLSLICFETKAQVYLNPFTRSGIGEMQPVAQVNRLGMGGTTYTETDPNRYSFANPATYSLLKYFSFEIGISGMYYSHRNEQTAFKNMDVNVPYISLAFPIDSAKSWG